MYLNTLIADSIHRSHCLFFFLFLCCCAVHTLHSVEFLLQLFDFSIRKTKGFVFFLILFNLFQVLCLSWVDIYGDQDYSINKQTPQNSKTSDNSSNLCFGQLFLNRVAVCTCVKLVRWTLIQLSAGSKLERFKRSIHVLFCIHRAKNGHHHNEQVSHFHLFIFVLFIQFNYILLQCLKIYYWNY